MGLSEKDKRIIESVENNEFVDDIDINNMKFIYSKDFYVMMAKLLKNGKSPIEAYTALGFDTTIVGENRAYKAAQKAKKLASKPNYGIDPLDYDGSIERSKMGTMTKEEEAAYLKARVLYLEKVVEFQKKFHRYWNRAVYLTSPRISY